MHEPGVPSNPRPVSSAGLRRRLYVLGAAALVYAAYVAGRNSRTSVVVNAGGPRPVLYYVDPMHPSYRSARPGKAPDCGMDLEPVYAGAEPAQSAAMNADGVRLTPDQEQSAHLQTEMVEAAPAAHTLRTAGRVVPDEGRTYRVSAGVDGWIRHVFSDRTGSQVKRGEALAAFYSKDISAPQQAFVYALESYEHLKRNPTSPAEPLALATQQLSMARDNLEFLGMGQGQREELSRTHAEIVDINLTAPADGQILERHVAVGQRFMKGELLYRIANLERVWVVADVPPGQKVLVAIAKARIQVPGRPPLEARIAPAAPQFDEQGRTGKLRLEVDNPHGVLLPGMIVNVDLDAPASSTITVHADAVIDSGTSQHVFVALGRGQYELREVETGWQDGDRVEIRNGLKTGERVVTAGAFLLDSESRMKSRASEVTDAQCGMKIERTASRRLEWKGATYYFCSESCERKFTDRRNQ
jgi:membrane fusion protein, copper/silver efflux system